MIRSRANAEELALEYSLSEEAARRAIENLKSKSSVILGFSGKMGSGKNTVADSTFAQMPEYLERNLHTDAFGDDLKKEFAAVLQATKESSSKESAAVYLAEIFGVEENEASVVVGHIYDELKSGALASSNEKTSGWRAGIQYWATEIRRGQDPDYWVKSVLRRSLEAVAEGRSVQITDVRFPNEVEALLWSGGKAIRLDVSEEQQRRRISLRDGFDITPESLRHSSETLLDDFDGFSLRILTDSYPSPETVSNLVVNFLRG